MVSKNAQDGFNYCLPSLKPTFYSVPSTNCLATIFLYEKERPKRHGWKFKSSRLLQPFIVFIVLEEVSQSSGISDVATLLALM